jgi:tetratricopeptide (TPR) repeat protein
MRRTALPIFLLVLAIWAVYLRVASADFIMWDDRYMLWDNPRLVPPSWTKTAELWTTPCLKLYTPVSYTLWSAVAALENQPPGATLTPGPFHVLSILLHSVAAAFLFLLLRELTGGGRAAWAGAMLFAIHPIQVEAVAWIAPTNGLVCGAFGMLALWQYVLHAKSSKCIHLTIAAVAYSAALLSKPTAVVLPLIAAVIDLWMIRRPLRAIAAPILAALIMATPILVITRRVQPSPDVPATSVLQRLFVAADAIGFYVQKLLYPAHFAADYERTPHWLLGHPGAFAWGGLVIAAGGGLLCISRRFLWLRAPLAIFPAALLPVLGLTPFDFQAYSTVADRYMYLPMIGAAMLLSLFLQRCRPVAGAAITAALLMILAPLSFAQTLAWQDTGTLTAQQLRYDPQSSTGHKMRAEWLSSTNHPAEAETEFRAAIAAIEAEGRHGEGGVWYGYGNLLLREKRYSEAIEIYCRGLPRMADDQKPLVHNNLGIALFETGNLEAARAEFVTALSLDPNLRQARQNLARLGRN